MCVELENQMSGAYREAAGVLEMVLSRKRGLRAAALAPHVVNKKRVLALVAKTLENQEHLERAVAAVKGAQKKLQAAVPNRAMRLLLLYDLLLGSGKISGGGKAARAVKDLEPPLARLLAPVAAANCAAAEAARASEAAGAAAAAGGGPGQAPPRYVRVNPLRGTSVAEAEAELRAFLAGAASASASTSANTSASASASAAGGGGGGAAVAGAGTGAGVGAERAEAPAVWRDEHVANLLACRPPRGVEFHSHPRVASGAWILQVTRPPPCDRALHPNNFTY